MTSSEFEKYKQDNYDYQGFIRQYYCLQTSDARNNCCLLNMKSSNYDIKTFCLKQLGILRGSR